MYRFDTESQHTDLSLHGFRFFIKLNKESSRKLKTVMTLQRGSELQRTGCSSLIAQRALLKNGNMVIW